MHYVRISANALAFLVAVLCVAVFCLAQTTPVMTKFGEDPGELNFGKAVPEPNWNTSYDGKDPHTLVLFHFERMPVNYQNWNALDFPNASSNAKSGLDGRLSAYNGNVAAQCVSSEAKFGKGCLSLDMDNRQFVRIPTLSRYLENDFTYEAWISISKRMAETPGEYYIFGGSYQTGIGIQVAAGDGGTNTFTLIASLPDFKPDFLKAQIPIHADEWHHVAITVMRNNFFDSTVKFYFDGEVIAQSIIIGDLWSASKEVLSTNLAIGALDLLGQYDRTDAVAFFDGKIDEVRISTVARAFDEKEVEGVEPASLWQFNKEAGEVAPTSGEAQEAAKTGSLVVVIGKSPQPCHVLAGEELVRYIKKLTGARIEVASEGDEIAKNASFLFLIDDLTYPSTEMVKEIADVPDNPDGFVVRSLKIDGKKCVAMIGRRPRGTLYAMYHYLDRIVGIGFFEDGEYIPKDVKGLPFKDKNVTEEPKFPLRETYWGIGWQDHWRGHLWAFRPLEWRNVIRYAMNKRINKCDFGPYRDIEKIKLDMLYDPSAYALLYFDTEEPPDWIIKRFPNLKYTKDADPYGHHWIIDEDALGQMYAENIKNNLNQLSRYDEANNTKTYTLEVGVDAEAGGIIARHLGAEKSPIFPGYIALEQLRKLVKDFKIGIRGWGLTLVYRSLDDVKKRLIEPLGLKPAEILTGTAYSGYLWPVYKNKFDYFEGYDWVFDYIDGFNCNDYYHADVPFDEIIKATKDILTNDKSSCVGIGLMPERLDCDPMFSYLFWRLAWDPFDVEDFDIFLKEDWLPHRYSKGSFDAMYASTKYLAEALDDSRLAADPYISGYWPIYRYSEYLGFHMVSRYWRKYVVYRDVVLLEKALTSALAVRDIEKENILYQRYVMNVFHNYASELSKLELIRAYSAYYQLTNLFKKGVTKGAEVDRLVDLFRKSAAAVDFSLLQIQKVWSTDPLYSSIAMFKELDASDEIKDTVARVTPAMPSSSVEVLANYYRPMVRTFLDDLFERISAREKELFDAPENWWTTYNWDPLVKTGKRPFSYPPIRVKEARLTPKLETVIETYLEDPFAACETFGGTAADAVSVALTEFEKHKMTTEHLADMATHVDIAQHYPLAQVYIDKVDVPEGAWKGSNVVVAPRVKGARDVFSYVFKPDYPIDLSFDYRIVDAGDASVPSKITAGLKMGAFDAVEIAALEIDTQKEDTNYVVNFPTGGAGTGKLIESSKYISTGVKRKAESLESKHSVVFHYDANTLTIGGVDKDFDMPFKRLEATIKISTETDNAEAKQPVIWIGNIVLNGHEIVIPDGVDIVYEQEITANRLH